MFVKIVDFVLVYSGESVVNVAWPKRYSSTTTETGEPINTKALNKNIIARRQRPLFSYYLPLTILFGTWALFENYYYYYYYCCSCCFCCRERDVFTENWTKTTFLLSTIYPHKVLNSEPQDTTPGDRFIHIFLFFLFCSELSKSAFAEFQVPKSMI